MTEQQWETLLALINGEKVTPIPTGFIIDSPWLQNWAGFSIMDYFVNQEVWFNANKQAIETFPQTICKASAPFLAEAGINLLTAT